MIRVGNSSLVNRWKTGEKFSPFHRWSSFSNLLTKLVKKPVNHRWNTGETVSPVTGSPLVRWIPPIPHTNHDTQFPVFKNRFSTSLCCMGAVGSWVECLSGLIPLFSIIAIFSSSINRLISLQNQDIADFGAGVMHGHYGGRSPGKAGFVKLSPTNGFVTSVFKETQTNLTYRVWLELKSQPNILLNPIYSANWRIQGYCRLNVMSQLFGFSRIFC